VHVRRLLDDAESARDGPGGYRLAVEPDASTPAGSSGCGDRRRRRAAAGDHAGASASLAAALGQWRGERCRTSAHRGPRPAARRLDEARLATLEDRIDADLALGRHAAVVGELEALTAEHPLRERLRGQLMLALALSGRQAEALEVFARTRALLAEELGSTPPPPCSASTRTCSPTGCPLRRARRTRTGGRARDRPALAGRLVRLPAPTSSFVGRETELGRLTTLMAEDRIVTVTGPGGAGKTRLAIEAARARPRRRRRRVGDVVFVGLATVEDPAAVPSVVAGAVGATGGRGARSPRCWSPRSPAARPPAARQLRAPRRRRSRTS
jgi:hypothetical protein